MSHKTTIKTELTNLGYMKKALQKLGFQFKESTKENQLKAKIMDGSTVDVELLITGNGKSTYTHQVGFKKTTDGTYEATGDFWGLRTADGKVLTQEYLKKEVTASSKEAELIDRLKKLGFDLANSKENNDCIELTLERWS